ncbi:STAS-like domain-containing protein [Plesiomonas shigelloides]|uniref:STAS-like domain-containing protein n=1 Tax=Plesiomonas shigelloides TaxID=703 RepID=UPI0012615305|nr:STAS-like domain-containing protein [Plesiomonas shigelloides]KAB7676545.1 DUF4325 domain-containing protein [Plesiomonas shigelloides]
MDRIAYKFPAGDLASRTQAIPQRHQIEALLKTGETVDLDLSDVLSLSESYSDEIFGVLVVKFGVVQVLSQIKVRNASPSILRSIAKVIQRRGNEVISKKVNSGSFDGPLVACC